MIGFSITSAVERFAATATDSKVSTVVSIFGDYSATMVSTTVVVASPTVLSITVVQKTSKDSSADDSGYWVVVAMIVMCLCWECP